MTERSGQNAAATDGTWHATDSCQWQWRGPLGALGPSEGRALAFAFCGALQLQMRVLIAKMTSGQNVCHNSH